MEKMAVDLNPPHPHSVASSGVLQILQYRDDSIDAWFKDGSRVALSGCATAFTHWRKVPSFQSQFQHEFGKQCGRTVWDKVHQYTQFAVSEYREKIAALVRFRNWFAERPFLCKSVVDTESIKVSTAHLFHDESNHVTDLYLITGHSLPHTLRHVAKVPTQCSPVPHNYQQWLRTAAIHRRPCSTGTRPTQANIHRLLPATPPNSTNCCFCE